MRGISRISRRFPGLSAWRRVVAGLAALAFLAQGLTLFVPSPGALSPAAAAIAELTQIAGAADGGPIICLDANGAGDAGHAPIHRHDGGDCPLCQNFGHAMAGAAFAGCLISPVAAVSRAIPRLAGDVAPRAPPRWDSRPRGPPFIV